MSLIPTLETKELIDLLAQHTRRLSELLAQKNLGLEYEQRKKILVELQLEIRRRQNSSTHTKTTNSQVTE